MTVLRIRFSVAAAAAWMTFLYMRESERRTTLHTTLTDETVLCFHNLRMNAGHPSVGLTHFFSLLNVVLSQSERDWKDSTENEKTAVIEYLLERKCARVLGSRFAIVFFCGVVQPKYSKINSHTKWLWPVYRVWTNRVAAVKWQESPAPHTQTHTQIEKTTLSTSVRCASNFLHHVSLPLAPFANHT